MRSILWFFSSFLLTANLEAAKPCLRALRFGKNDFKTSEMVAVFSSPKNAKVDYSRWAGQMANAALAMLQRGDSAEAIFRYLGKARHDFAQRNDDYAKERAGVLVWELPNAPQRSAPRAVGGFPGLYADERTKEYILERSRRIQPMRLNWPDNSTALTPLNWRDRIFSTLSPLRRARVTEIGAPSPLVSGLVAMETRHYLFVAGPHLLSVEGESFRDTSFEIDLDQGDVRSNIMIAPESKRAFAAICRFIDRLMLGKRKGRADFRDPESQVVEEIFYAEKLYAVAMPFSNGGNAIGQIMWSSIWSVLLDQKHIVPLEREIFAHTSLVDTYVAERMEYLRGFLAAHPD